LCLVVCVLCVGGVGFLVFFFFFFVFLVRDGKCFGGCFGFFSFVWVSGVIWAVFFFGVVFGVVWVVLGFLVWWFSFFFFFCVFVSCAVCAFFLVFFFVVGVCGGFPVRMGFEVKTGNFPHAVAPDFGRTNCVYGRSFRENPIEEFTQPDAFGAFPLLLHEPGYRFSIDPFNSC